MALWFSIHFQPFAPKKMGFWVKKGKILKISQFLTRLTYEALEAYLCFPKAWKMFVSREDIQTMILSTERPLCHVGEPRYGPPKFFGGKPKIPENAFLPFESILCLYSPKWYSEAPIGLIWKHLSSLWVILGVFVRKKTNFAPKITQKYNRKKVQKSGKSRQDQFYHTNCNWWLSVHPTEWFLAISDHFAKKGHQNCPKTLKTQWMVWPSRQSKAQQGPVRPYKTK